MCGEGWGPLELQLEKRPGVTDKASIAQPPHRGEREPTLHHPTGGAASWTIDHGGGGGGGRGARDH